MAQQRLETKLCPSPRLHASEICRLKTSVHKEWEEEREQRKEDCRENITYEIINFFFQFSVCIPGFSFSLPQDRMRSWQEKANTSGSEGWTSAHPVEQDTQMEQSHQQWVPGGAFLPPAATLSIHSSAIRDTWWWKTPVHEGTPTQLTRTTQKRQAILAILLLTIFL